MVSRHETYTGVFVAEYTSGGQTRSTLRDAKNADGVGPGLLLLQFDLDIEQVLLHSGVEAIYGSPAYLVHPAAVRGCCRRHSDAEGDAVLDSIVYLELVDETPDRLVTYAFQWDGVGQKHSVAFSLPSGTPEPEMVEGEQVRLACRYVYFPKTKRLTITATQSGNRIRVPQVVVPQLLERLPYGITEDRDGATVPILSTSGTIEGRLQTDGSQAEGLLIAPDVLTFDVGTSIHRLWTQRSTFRWLVDEQLVAPIP